MADVTPMLIGSKEVTTDEVAVVRSPFDGSEVGRVPVAGERHLDAAVAESLDRHREGALPAWKRAEVLDRAASAIASRADELAMLMAREAAKPLATSRVEVARAVDTFRFSAAVARTASGETVPLEASAAGEGKLGFVLRMPVGVVAGISPFNFPLNLVAHKVAPAIAAGCPIVLKPASATPLTALALGRILLDECELPPGWLHVVTCSGRTAEHLVTHPDVAMITFTGSPDVGWGIKAKAPRKRVSLELGNNTPVIVEPDADIEDVARRISVAGYSFAGQSCISVQRVFVQSSVYERFVDALTERVRLLRAGDPLDESTDVSALIDPAEAERVRAWIDEAVAGGARLTCGGETLGEGLLAPAVLADVHPGMRVQATEVFGPVVGVQPYEHLEHALALANETRYGLQAGIFTSDLGKALQAARTLDFGGITVNEVPTWRADQMPYGGVRDSGNTREGPAYAVREMTEERLVIIQP